MASPTAGTTWWCTTTTLALSSYGKFGRENEDDDDEEEEEDDDEDEEYDDDDEEDDDYDDLDDQAVQDFRTRMSSLFDSSANKAKDDESIADELLQITAIGRGSALELQTPQEWARPMAVETIRAGCILVANPRAFCSDFGTEQTQQRRSSPSPQLLSKFGLTLPPPADLGADRRADLLPVLVVTEYDPQTTAAKAVLLNRRTGYLLGDLEQPEAPSSSSSSSSTSKPILEKFCIQPLWFGGVDTSANSNSAGLDMLHQCPTVPGSQQITDDGLYWGGDPAQAQDALDNQQQQSQNRILTGFDFKFFVQATNFPPGELQRELNAETFFVCTVAKEILFKSRDRMGTRRAKPLWTEIMELMGGEYRQVRDRLYGVDDEDENDDFLRPGGGFGLLQ